MIWELFSYALVFQIFVLLNPLSSVPVLMSAYKLKMNVRKIAFNAVFLAYVIAISIAFIGPHLFNVFGITLDSFRIAGGLLLLFLGLDTARGKKKEKKEVGKMDTIVSIIATPLLTGPATMSFITIKTYELGLSSLLLNITCSFFLVGIIFIIFSLMIPRINEKLINILSRVLALFLIAVSIEMIAKGIIGLFGLHSI